MRPCFSCVSRGLLCSVSEASDHCVEYYRTHRRYELASPMAEVERLALKAEKLREQRLEAERKAIRLRTQERALYKKMRELGDRENQNILDLEAEEALERVLAASQPPTGAGSGPAPGVSPGPAGFSPVSFGSLDRTSLVPTGSS